MRYNVNQDDSVKGTNPRLFEDACNFAFSDLKLALPTIYIYIYVIHIFVYIFIANIHTILVVIKHHSGD